jgi:hypothetical protein
MVVDEAVQSVRGAVGSDIEVDVADDGDPRSLGADRGEYIDPKAKRGHGALDHVEDRLSLKQTARHVLDRRTTFPMRAPVLSP